MKKSVKKVAAILATAVMAFSAPSSTLASAVNDNYSMYLTSTIALPGDTSSVLLSETSENRCACYQIYIEYDERLTITESDIKKASGKFLYVDKETGNKGICINGFTGEYFKDNSILAVLNFTVPEDAEAGDEFAVKITYVKNFGDVEGEFTEYTTQDAVIKVLPKVDQSLVVKPKKSTENDGNTGNGSAEAPTESNLNKLLMLEVKDESGTVIGKVMGICGDANGDGKADIRDASAIASFLANSAFGSDSNTKVDETGMLLGDVNLDGTFNIRDAAYVAKDISKQIVKPVSDDVKNALDAYNSMKEEIPS